MNSKILQSLGLAVVVVAGGCATPPSPSVSPTPHETTVGGTPPTPDAPVSPITTGWQVATVPASANASSVVGIAPGGEGLLAIGFDGAFGTLAWTSPDGTAWTDVTPGGFASIGIASVIPYEGGLIGVGRRDTINVEAEAAAVFRSSDGIAWRAVPGGDDMRGQVIDVVATDGGLVAVGGVPGADAAGVWRSADGETWERSGGDIPHAFMWAVAAGGPGLVAVGWRRNPEPDLAVWTSPDGAAWTLSPDPPGFEGYEATDVIEVEGELVMVGSGFRGEEGRIWTSDDGLAWELADVEGGMDGAYARTLADTPTGVVAVGGSDSQRGVAWFSTEGEAWQSLGNPVSRAFFQVAYATDDRLLIAGASQGGTQETGIESHASIWSAALVE